MKVVIFGATGKIGQSIVKEALSRGHEVTAVNRKTQPLGSLTTVSADITDSDSVAEVVRGHDAVISAYGPGNLTDREALSTSTQSLIDGLHKGEVKRLLMVGGAGSLQVSPGVELLDTPEFPDEYKEMALGHRDALAVLKGCDLQWTNLSPSATIQSGPQTGDFRTGTEQLLVDEDGKSHISYDDYAAAMIDELERGRNAGRRFTVGY